MFQAQALESHFLAPRLVRFCRRVLGASLACSRCSKKCRLLAIVIIFTDASYTTRSPLMPFIDAIPSAQDAFSLLQHRSEFQPALGAPAYFTCQPIAI